MSTRAVSVESRDRYTLLWIDHPPGNVLDVEVRVQLRDAVLAAREQSEAIVISGRGRAFSTGADLKELASAEKLPGFRELLDTIESCPRPVVAAANGLALGAGLETMLACHYRCAAPGAAFGLPEIALEVIPGAGGTQRLPRLIGARQALGLILSGRPITAKRALELGLVDRVTSGDFSEAVDQYVCELLQSGAAARQTRRRQVDATQFDDVFSAGVTGRRTATEGAHRAGAAALAAIRAAIDLPFEAGLDRERSLAHELLELRRRA
jgi:3-hydroxyacyl-CoA dehydrogenase